MNPLEGAILKAEWAQRHLQGLETEIKRVFGDERQAATTNVDAQNPPYIFRREIGNPPHKEWGLRVGDIATNLRDSLDHVAYQLALQGPLPHDPIMRERALSRIYFPIFKERNNSRFREFTRYFKPDARKQVERFQPYNTLDRWPDIDGNLLWVINELARIGKHRSINIMLDTAFVWLDFLPQTGTLQMSFDDTGIVATLTELPYSHEQLKPEISVQPHIELTGRERIYHFHATGCLEEAYKLIANEVIPAFSSILPETKDPV